MTLFFALQEMILELKDEEVEKYLTNCDALEFRSFAIFENLVLQLNNVFVPVL